MFYCILVLSKRIKKKKMKQKTKQNENPAM